MRIQCQQCGLVLEVARFPLRCICGLITDEQSATVVGSDVQSHRKTRRTISELFYAVTKLCIRCEAFPCLGPTDCKHEKAIRLGKLCPQAKWFWV